MDFKDFRAKVKAQFDLMQRECATLYTTAISKDDVYEAYLASYPIEERQGMTCSNCQSSRRIEQINHIATGYSFRIIIGCFYF